MTSLNKSPFFVFLLFLTACVTINVYFPAAAAESAADRIIQEVYGEQPTNESESATSSELDNQSGIRQDSQNLIVRFISSIFPAAHAQQPDINISSPGINKLKSLMKGRHQLLSKYYSGAIGMDNNGLITMRDAKAVPLKERNTVKKLVSDENRDRNSLYSEIAKANNHPEWEKDIRKTFASRWIVNAPSGWWYRGVGGGWQRK